MHRLHASANWHACSAGMHDSLTLMPGNLLRPLPNRRLLITNHNVVVTLYLNHITVVPTKWLLQSLLYKQTRSVSMRVSVVQVHERTLQGDFLMALLRDLLISRRTAGHPLKVRLPRFASVYLTRQAGLQ